MKKSLKLVLLGLCAVPLSSQAYPSFIGYGYTSCIVCHYNAFGNGPLSDYGRALGATAISAKPFYNPSISDEKYGNQSGFFGDPENLGQHLRAQMGYRGMYMKVPSIHRWINMQADASLIYKTEEDRFVALATVGYSPPPGGAKTSSEPKMISREHYISWVQSQHTRIYVGMTDVVFGIRTPDHISAPRELVKVAQNDQVHGVSLHIGYPNKEMGLHAFVGNLFQDHTARPYGLSGMGEWDIAEKVRFGGSFLASASMARYRGALATHLRAGFGKGCSLLFESGLVSDNAKGATDKTLSSYFFTQSMARVQRGLHVLFTAEYRTADTFRPTSRDMRYGPSIQWFPVNRLEIRSDFYGSRSIGGPPKDTEPSDSFMWLGQVHLWF